MTLTDSYYWKDITTPIMPKYLKIDTPLRLRAYEKPGRHTIERCRSIEEITEVLDLKEAGYTIFKISDFTGLTINQVRYILDTDKDHG